MLDRYWQTAQLWASQTGNPVVKGFFGTLNTYPFSNHALVPTYYKGAWYKSSEHAYLAEQAREYGRHDLAAAWTKGEGYLMEGGRRFDWANPKQVKAYSTKAFRPYRKPTHPARIRWMARRVTVMWQIVMSKFRRNATAKDALLRSGHQFLVEASPHDDFWGIGTRLDSQKGAFDDLESVPTAWGQNRLGLIVMGVRNALRHRKARTKELSDRARRFLVARARKRGTIVRPSAVRKVNLLIAKGVLKLDPTQPQFNFTAPVPGMLDPLAHFQRQLVPGTAAAVAETKRKPDRGFNPVPALPATFRRTVGVKRQQRSFDSQLLRTMRLVRK